MCAIFGFVNYGEKINYKKLKKLVRELSIASEVRGTDATGISYVKDGVVKIFKKPKPAI
jgi:glucosamine 6-phosphate synthetase-like amidotransferase/phosphosugar isomerase protein